jgi:hypothetical protein
MFYGLGSLGVNAIAQANAMARQQAAAAKQQAAAQAREQKTAAAANAKIQAAAVKQQAAAQKQADAQARQQTASDARAQAQANTAAEKQFAADAKAATQQAQQAARATQQQAAQAQAAAKRAEAQAKTAERQGNQAQAQANRQAAAAAKASQKQATAQGKIDTATAAQAQAQQDVQNFQAMATQFPSPAVVPAGGPGFDPMFATGAPAPIGANFGTAGPVDYTGDIYGGGVSLPVASPAYTSPAYSPFSAPTAAPYQPQYPQYPQPNYSSGLPAMPTGGGPLFAQPNPSMQQPQFDDSAAAYPETQDSGVQLDDGSQVQSQADYESSATGVDSGDYSSGVDFSMAGLNAAPPVNWWLVGGALLLGWYLLKKKN